MSANLAYDERQHNLRYELINGAEKLLARPAVPHANVAGNIFGILHSYLRGKKCKVFGEVDVFFDEQSRLVPDIIVVCDRRKIKYDGIHGAPDLVIEILSPGTAQNDRIVKKAVYEKYGVQEYWLVNPKDRSVEVFHHDGQELAAVGVYHAYEPKDWEMMSESEQKEQQFSVKVSLYPDLSITVQDIFEDI